MCGIAGYVGDRNAPELLFEMLKRLEYRGYDSAGIACISDGSFSVFKDKGTVSEVMEKSGHGKINSKIGIAHTRWATHGEPSKRNAHPHGDRAGRFIVVHNGIIENYRDLKAELSEKGHTFRSDTDTEVIPHLIEDAYKKDFEAAFVSALKKLRGSFAVSAVCCDVPDRILVARKDSPLIIGLGEGENYIASDTPAVLPYTKKIIILEDFDYGVVMKDSVVVKDIATGEVIEKQVHSISWDIKQAEKEGFPHFMLKEIFEEPAAVQNAAKAVSDMKRIVKKLKKYKRIYFVGCGTASYAALVGKYLLERFSIPSEMVLGSEFRYSTVNVVGADCAIIAVSQSGETADTLASVKAAKSLGAYVIGVVNVVGSTLTRVADDVIYTYSGPEIAVASTKVYVGQVASLTLFSVHLAYELEKVDKEYLQEIVDGVCSLSEKTKQILADSERIKALAEKLSDRKIFFYIGRRLNYPTALEGALKIKEISYVHAEAYPAGELKHGPLALLESGVPVVAICPNDDLLEKLESNIQETRARNAQVLVVSESGDFETPVVDPLLSPILYITPLHLFAYYIAVGRGLDPDKPRNLAKSVTVE
jgi:glucosamine--fructose-6-phosphate aminotransferase (isomerizing)